MRVPDDTALLDADPRGNPFVGRIHDFAQFFVGEYVVGDIPRYSGNNSVWSVHFYKIKQITSQKEGYLFRY
jgi:hypothetical protein